jgi:hypothetical protein
MGLVRKGKRKVRGRGFLVTWDVDSRDRRAANRMQYFLFGRKDRKDKHDDPVGFAWKRGVRNIAQSAVFVEPLRLADIERFLRRNRIDFDMDELTFA